MMTSRLIGLLLAILAGLTAIPVASPAQTPTVYELHNDIPVFVGGNALRAAWAGGLNSPQFNAIDLDQDGFRDLVIFDRMDNTLLTFLNHGASGIPDFHYAPRFAASFPTDLSQWMLLADFDQDGYEDIFTNLPGTSNIRVFRNITASNGGTLAFTLFTDTIFSDYSPYIPLYAAKSDLPAVIDLDEDGDLDIITFHLAGRELEWHRNMSMENHGDLLHMEFFVQSHCFGHVKEGNNSCEIDLEIPPCNPGQRLTSPLGERSGLHTGSTLMALDLNADSLKELLVGDVSCSNIIALHNAGTLEVAHFDYQDETFPSNNGPIDIPVFPATFYLDLDNDGVRDLVAASNRTYDTEDVRGVSWHRNSGLDNAPVFQPQGFGLMQEEMIETGTGAAPFFFDYDGDGLQDLLIGNLGRWDSLEHHLGHLQLFRNTGTAQQPAFTLVNDDFLGLMGSSIIAPDEYLVPAAADLDQDGDPDLLLGKADGQLHYFRNDAGPGNPAVYVYVSASYAGIDAGLYSAPELYDMDGDGDFDLLIGNHRGWVQYYENTGSVSSPSFSKVTDSLGRIKINDFTGDPLTNGFARPRIVDADRDGHPELIVGTVEGKVRLYDQLSLNPGAAFTDLGDLFQYDFGTFSCPAAAVLDSSRLSYVVGTNRGGLMLLRDTGVVGSAKPSDQVSAYLTVYPNPAQDRITVALEGVNRFSGMEIELWDGTGRRVLSTAVKGASTELSVSGLSSGIYFLQVNGGDTRLTKRLVIAK